MEQKYEKLTNEVSRIIMRHHSQPNVVEKLDNLVPVTKVSSLQAK